MGEKRVVFNEGEQQQDYSDGEHDQENDKRPLSKLHRRDTPHHLKNKRVQQHLTDKAANVILSKLKEMPPQTVIEEVVSPIEANPMPLIQDVGLPIIDHYPENPQNGIDLSAHSAHPGGKFQNFPFTAIAQYQNCLINMQWIHMYPSAITVNGRTISIENTLQLGIPKRGWEEMGFLSA